MNIISKCSRGAEGITASGLESSSGLFVDDVALLASSNGDVQLTLEEFAAEFEVFGSGISTCRSEAMVLRWKRVECKISVGDEFRPQVPEFKYIRGLLKKLTVGLVLPRQCCRRFTGLLQLQSQDTLERCLVSPYVFTGAVGKCLCQHHLNFNYLFLITGLC